MDGQMNTGWKQRLESWWPRIKFWGISAVLIALSIGLCVSLMQWDIIRDEAYQAGYDDGHKAGKTAGYDTGLEKGKTWAETTHQKEVTRLNDRISSLEEERDSLQTQIEEKDSKIKELEKRASSQESNAVTPITASAGISGGGTLPATRSTTTETTNDWDSWGGAGVYVTNTGSKYHRAGCRYLNNSAHSMSLSQAQAAGYSACSVCW